ncbi:FAD-dependent oxidoreductase [Geodermatophilus sp. YIM 151500]|uniref:NAD(P)/FAD-dependent oxidoreductase n=1 Tax=Geodermatophilus sp. YIM 151500 TaxID=2984531 RepID=UPI0021E44022|nr:FAD-dependent oxidoreductase [Geodermatophilus sp. YIM 151500]MCV2491817.1 FAD-dependent oxidoreductase [Geodermatophilus sp. YIM 151500]
MAAAAAYVIVGAGLAGAKAAETLRSEGFDGPVVLLGDDPERPYERPPLSKGYLLGSAERDGAFVHDAGWYAGHDVELRTGVRVASLDLAAHAVVLASGERLTWARLLLTTGAAPRRPDLPGADLGGVRYLRTLADSDALRADLTAGGRRVVVVGAGWIGLEVAAAARTHGNDVTVVEPRPTPLHEALGPTMGEVFARLHRNHGVDVRTGTGVREIAGADGGVRAVRTDDGQELPADLVVVGVGVVPNTALAEAAGLDVGDGVVVDAALRTSHRDVHAAGDVAAVWNPYAGRHLRVEHWANALNGGPAAARSMLGQPVTYDRVPYFFTDQYELGMEYSGLGRPDDDVVVRGRVDDGEFVAFWLRDGRVVAGMNVNVWGVTDEIQGLVRSDRPVDVDRLTDPDVALGSLLG